MAGHQRFQPLLQNTYVVSMAGHQRFQPLPTASNPFFLFDAVVQMPSLLANQLSAQLPVSVKQNKSDVDSSTLLHQARNALGQLVTKDQRFSAFESSLLSDSLSNSTLQLMPTDMKAKIDASIANLLPLLSPFLLTKPAAVLLDWLCVRFNIDRFNVHQLMLCILPYHESGQFVSIVSTIQLEDSACWSWLSKIKKTKAPLDRNTLVTRCITDASVLNAIFEAISVALAKQITNKPLFSFFATTLVHFLAASKVNDKTVRTILPTIFKIIKIRRESDLQSSALMIFAQISQRVALTAPVISEILTTITHHTAPNLEYLALLTLLTICQSQHSQVVKFDEKITARILAFTDFENQLVKMSLSYDIASFISPLVAALISESQTHPQYYTTLRSLVNSTNQLFPQSEIPTLCEALLTRSLQDQALQDQECSSLTALLQSLQQRHSASLAQTISDTIDSTRQSSAGSLDALYAFISKTFTGQALSPDIENAGIFYQTLQSVDESVRFVAVSRLVQIIGTIHADKSDDVFVGDVLFDRLSTDSPRIIRVILGADLDLPRLVGPRLVPVLVAIVESSGTNSVGALKALYTLDLVCWGRVCFGAMCPDSKNLELSAAALELSAIPSKSPGAAASTINLESVSSVARSILDSSSTTGHHTQILAFLTHKDSSDRVRSFALLVLAQMIQQPGSTDRQSCVSLAAHIIGFLGGGEILPLAIECGSAVECLLADRLCDGGSECLPLAAGFVVKSIIEFVMLVPSHPPAATDCVGMQSVEAVTPTHTLARDLFALIVSKGLDKNLVRLFVQGLGEHSVLEFFAHFIVTGGFSDKIVTISLLISTEFIKRRVSGVATGCIIDFQLFVPLIIPCLQHPGVGVRKLAIDCLRAVNDAYNVKASSKNVTIYAYDQFYGAGSNKLQYLTVPIALQFTTAVLEHKQEMISDSACLPHVLQRIAGEKGAGGEWTDSVILFLASCVLASPIPAHRVQLLRSLDSIDSNIKLTILYPLVEAMVAHGADVEFGSLLVRMFCMDSAKALLEGKQKKYFTMFLKLLQGGFGDQAFAIQKSILDSIGAGWFGSLTLKKQSLIFSILISIPATGGDVEVALSAKKLLGVVRLEAVIVVCAYQEFSKRLLDIEGGGGASAQNKKHKGECVSTAAIDPAMINSLTALLELSGGVLQINSRHELVPVLFELLGAVVGFQQTNGLSVSLEYVKQLILSILLNLINESLVLQQAQAGLVLVDESMLRVDHVVRCIRGTDNPQTHNASLVLMAAIANVSADSVLVNIMPVFTFMGANVLRQDDNYSFHVIRQTLETILPALLSKHKVESAGREMELVLAVKPIIKVFVDALFHIPKHRRLRLFTILVSVLGEMEFLQSIVSLLASKSVGSGTLLNLGAVGAVSAVNPSVLEFAGSVSCHFPVPAQLNMLLKSLKLVAGTPSIISADVSHTVLFFSPSEFTQPQLFNMKIAHMQCFSLILSSKTFLDKIGQFEDMSLMESYHVQLVEVLFTLLSQAKAEQTSFRQQGNKGGVLFATDLTSKVYTALEKVHDILSLPSFIRVMSVLLVNDDDNVVFKCVNLINDKIVALKTITHETSDQLLKLVPLLINIASSKEDATKQIALLCLATMVTNVGKRNAEVYIKVLPLASMEISSSNCDLATSALACVASLCHVFGPRTITHLPKFMPAVLNIVSSVIEKDDVSKNTQNYIYAAMNALSVIVRILPKFISPYIPTILSFALAPFFLHRPDNNKMRQRIADKNLELCLAMTEKVPCRMILPAVYNHLKVSLAHGVQSTMMLFRMISRTIECMNSTELLENYGGIFKFYLFAFDFQSLMQSDVSDTQIASIQDELIASFLRFVGKLNDTMFRSLFLKMVEWGTSDPESSGRLSLFYSILSALIDKLKSLFTPYCGYVIDNAVSILADFAKPDSDSVSPQLWKSVISFMQKFLLHESEGMITADKFKKIYPILVSQIHTKNSHDGLYPEHMSKYLVPTIGQLAVNVHLDDLWKPLNQAILLESRHEDPDVRLVCLKVVEEMYRVLGEDLLVFLPETIPFLAELKEDDDPLVEKLCIKVCAGIEVLLGESLDEYFQR